MCSLSVRQFGNNIKRLKLGICLDMAVSLLGIYTSEMIMSMHKNYAQECLHLHCL